MYGHLANGILLFASMYLKKLEKRNFAEALQILVIAVGYGYPIMKAIFNLKMRLFQPEMPHSDIACWIYIDICFFFFWLLALHFFLFWGYWFKFKSIRKSNYDDISEANRELQSLNEDYTSLWNSKDSDDFLRYLKWEAFTYGYFFSMFLMICFV